jgi:hypothetical protein
MINEIKPGYTLFITSYLGDADYYNTEVVTGLNRSQAKLVERFVRGCISGYNHPEVSLYDRDGDKFDMSQVYRHFTESDLDNVFNAVYPGAVLSSRQEEQVAEALSDLTYDLFGSACEYTGSLRCFDGLKVAYFPDHQTLEDSVN